MDARRRGEAHAQGKLKPCLWILCKYSLYLDVDPRNGALKLNFPDLEPWEMTESCALDVAERGGARLEEVGAIMNITRERVRQIELPGVAAIEAHLRDALPRRRLPMVNGGRAA